MTLSNKLTLSRILVTPVFVLLLSLNFPGNYLLALIIFLLAMFTDYLDGALARSRGEVTRLGMFLDPLADKILIGSAFIIFIGLPGVEIPAWVTIVIITREFAITGLRLVAAGQGVALPAGRWGKHKTLSQMIAVSGILFYLCLLEDTRFPSGGYRWVIDILVYITVAMTILSGAYYITKNFRFFRNRIMTDNLPSPGEDSGGE